MSKAVKCPVCGQTELVDDGDVCDVCKCRHNVENCKCDLSGGVS